MTLGTLGRGVGGLPGSETSDAHPAWTLGPWFSSPPLSSGGRRPGCRGFPRCGLGIWGGGMRLARGGPVQSEGPGFGGVDTVSS